MLQVMTIVGLIANSGITVCSAIHCPTTYSFSLFSSVMLLSKGKVVMAGGLAQLAALLEQSNLLEQLPDMTLLGSKAASSARLGKWPGRSASEEPLFDPLDHCQA
jgi:hypothetical protein